MRFKRGRQRPVARPPLDNRDFMSYHSARLPRDSQPSRPTRNPTAPQTRWRPTLGNIPIYLASLVMLICAGYVITLEPKALVQVVSATSQSSLPRPKETYAAAADQLLGQSIFNRTKLTVNVSGLQKQLRDMFPELEAVNISLPLVGQRPVIDLVPRQAAIKLASQQGIFLVDGDGRALIKTVEAAAQDHLTIPQVVDESDLEIKPGQAILTSQAVDFITIVNQQLTAAKLEVESLVLPASANEIRIKLRSTPYYIKFNLENDPRLSAGAFLALKQRLEATGEQPREYIDLRLEEKAFYR